MGGASGASSCCKLLSGNSHQQPSLSQDAFLAQEQITPCLCVPKTLGRSLAGPAMHSVSLGSSAAVAALGVSRDGACSCQLPRMGFLGISAALTSVVGAWAVYFVFSVQQHNQHKRMLRAALLTVSWGASESGPLKKRQSGWIDLKCQGRYIYWLPLLKVPHLSKIFRHLCLSAFSLSVFYSEWTSLIS